jgi:hypothetical protein
MIPTPVIQRARSDGHVRGGKMITLFRWLKHGKALPKGWTLAEQSLTHHHHYGVLIMRKAKS